jgi:phage terminase large subunit
MRGRVGARSRWVNGRLRDAKKLANFKIPGYARPLFRPCRYKVIYGGRGAGRSWSVAQALLIKAAQQPLRILCTRELQTSLRDSVLQLLRDLIQRMGIEGYTVLQSEIRHANGSLFIFEGLRFNVAKIKSLEGIDIVWVEEAERISANSWDVLIPTIRKEGSEIWVTFNPDQEDDSTYKRFVTNPPPNSWVLKVSWADNPWLTKELRDEKDYAYSVDPDSAEHVWGGELRKVSNAQVLHGKWIIEEFEVGAEWEGPYQGMDFGFAEDPFASVRCWIYRNRLYVRDEVFKLHLELDHIPAEVTGAIPGFANYVTRGDSARPDSISHLQKHGLTRLEGAKKGPNSVEDGVAFLRSFEKIVIHPSCRHTADEAKRYSYKVDARSGDIKPEILDKHNHLMDAIRYALEPLMKKQRKMDVLFASSTTVNYCPRCSSFLGDAPECPHCGLVRGAEATNGNGHGNGTNGNGHKPPRPSRFRSSRIARTLPPPIA